jgi:hypothetical protein
MGTQRPDTGDVGNLGASIVALTDEPAERRRPEVEIIAGPALVAAARETPFVGRLERLRQALGATRSLSIHEAVAVWRGELRRTPPHPYHVDDAAAVSLLAAVDGGLLALSEDQATVTATPDTALAREQPLTAWGESLMPLLLADTFAAIEPHPRWHDEAVRPVSGLLYQYLVMGGRQVPLTPVLDGLVDETERLDRDPIPSRTYLAGQLRLILTLQVEHGIVDWEPGAAIDDLGSAAPTGLGLFGWLIWTVAMSDELPPLLREMITDGGYLPADGGFVHRDDIPVPITSN